MKLSTDSWTRLDDKLEGATPTADDSVAVWARAYTFNAAGSLSNALVLRIAKGELVIISPPMSMQAADFEALELHGEVVAIVAPNGFHHLGLPEWSARYPSASIHAHPKAAGRIAKKHPQLPAIETVEALAPRLPASVQIFDGPHLKTPDVFARIDLPAGRIWYSNDVLGNTPSLPPNPVLKALFKWTRSGPGFAVNRLVLKFLRTTPKFGPWLKGEMREHPPAMVVPGHGLVVAEGDVAAQTQAVLESGL